MSFPGSLVSSFARQHGLSGCLLGSSAGFCLFQVAWLVSECLSTVLSVGIHLGEGKLNESGQFQGLPKTFELLTSKVHGVSPQDGEFYLSLAHPLTQHLINE